MSEALGELRRCAGTQFDPAAIEALEAALAKHPWRAEPEIERLRHTELQHHDQKHHGHKHDGRTKEKNHNAAAV